MQEKSTKRHASCLSHHLQPGLRITLITGEWIRSRMPTHTLAAQPPREHPFINASGHGWSSALLTLPPVCKLAAASGCQRILSLPKEPAHASALHTL